MGYEGEREDAAELREIRAEYIREEERQAAIERNRTTGKQPKPTKSSNAEGQGS